MVPRKPSTGSSAPALALENAESACAGTVSETAILPCIDVGALAYTKPSSSASMIGNGRPITEFATNTSAYDAPRDAPGPYANSIGATHTHRNTKLTQMQPPTGTRSLKRAAANAPTSIVAAMPLPIAPMSVALVSSCIRCN